MGQMANAVRAKLEDALEKRRTALDAAALESKLEAEAVDVTIPGKPVEMGHQHPMNRVLQEVKEIFIGMGYQIVDGPEIEEAAYNFTKLNIEEGHPCLLYTSVAVEAAVERARRADGRPRSPGQVQIGIQTDVLALIALSLIHI